MPQRRSAYKIFDSVILAHRQKLCQHLELPDTVKGILRSPKNEDNWDDLESLRLAIVDIIEGRSEVEEGGDRVVINRINWWRNRSSRGAR